MNELKRPEAAEGLLEQIADTALDDDYYVVRSGAAGQSHGFNTLLTGLAFAVFALLVAIAAMQTRSDRPATERERNTLINDVDARKASLAKREVTVERLRTRVEGLKAAAVGVDPAYEELRLVTAAGGATGPGIRLKITPNESFRDTVTDRDLRMLVNALWYAGAEAVAVNGKRIGTLSSVRTAAGVMKINYEPVGPPYEIVALGDAESLEDRFSQTAVGRVWEARGKRPEMRFDVTGSDELTVEAAPKNRLRIRQATAIEGDQ